MNTNKMELTVNEMERVTGGGQAAESLKDGMKKAYIRQKNLQI